MSEKEPTPEYVLEASFGIDHGELDGIDPVNAFTMGVEWEMFRQYLLTPGLNFFDRTVHAANRDRLVALAARYGRRTEVEDLEFGYSRILVGGALS